MKRVTIWVLLVCFMTFVNCIGESAMAEALITPEELIAACGISEDDVSLENLSEVIKRFGITTTAIESTSTEEIKEVLASMLASDYNDNYLYLFDTPVAIALPESLSIGALKRIAVFDANEMFYETALIDFECSMVYADRTTFFFEDSKEAEIAYPLLDEKKVELTDILGRIDWTELNTKLSEKSDSNDSGFAYGISFETENGVTRFMICSDDVKEYTDVWDVVHELIVSSIGDAYYEWE